MGIATETRPVQEAASGPPVRVAFYCDSHELGGAEVALANLVAALSPRFEVVVVGTDPRVLSFIAARRPTATRVLLPRIERRRSVRAIAAHLRAVRGLRPDVLHVNLNSPWSSEWMTLFGLVTRGVRVIAVDHMPQPIPQAPWRLRKRLISTRLSAHVTVGQRSAVNLARLAGLPPGSIRTIYNGVPDVELEPLSRAEDGPVVGSVGRLELQKGYDLLVRALPELGGVTAVIVGDGTERAPLGSLAEQLGVSERLVLGGWSDEPRRHLSAFDVFVLPSRLEAGPPLAVIEAMLAKLAVVATDIDNMADAVVDGETGLLVPPEDPSALARAVRALLRDPARREEMGGRARERAKARFGVERMAEAYESLYDEVLRT